MSLALVPVAPVADASSDDILAASIQVPSPINIYADQGPEMHIKDLVFFGWYGRCTGQLCHPLPSLRPPHEKKVWSNKSSNVVFLLWENVVFVFVSCEFYIMCGSVV